VSAAPEVTVVIPTHNRWHLLEHHALRSALLQQDVNLEVVVVDDGSTEQAPALSGLVDPRVRLIRHDVPRNVCAARNSGIASARGEWIAFLDDDDLWSPRKLREQLDGAAAAGADWSYTAAVAVDESGRVLELEAAPLPDAIESLLFTGNHVPGGTSSVVARASLVELVGGFDEGVLFLADWDLWLRLARVARPAVCAEVLVARLVHPGNMLFREGPNVLPSFERMLGKHRAVTTRDRQTIDEWIAQRYHDAGARREAARRYLQVAVRYRSPANAVAGIGALFGPRGLRAASGLLRTLGGTSHLDVDRPRPEEPPDWLEDFS
jgi:glycosyltransferase involved in cell wall biosynthesis